MTPTERAQIRAAAKKRAAELGPLTDAERQAMRPLLREISARAYARAEAAARSKSA